MWINLDMELSLLYVVAILLICFDSTFGTVVSSDPAVTCMLDDDDTNDELGRCLRMGSDYVEGYLNSMKPGKRKKHFDRCGSFEDFDNCLTPLLQTCPSFHVKLHSHWRNLYDTIRCACSDDEGCKRTVDCYEQEQKGLLSRRCEAMYKFNIKQNTRDKCHFLKDSIHCKEALVATACGDDAGLFAFHIAKLAAKLSNRKHSCTLSHKKEKYRGFSYSDQCPANFTAHMSQCKQQFLYDTSLAFHEHNDLVADGNRKDVRQACRDYRAYMRCLGPIEEKCKDGIKTLLSYDGGLRTYLLKMDYICDEVKSEYTAHLSCYRNVLKNRTLARCDHKWEALSPMLKDVTAHRFYCEAESPNSQELTAILYDLRACYEDVFTESCGMKGGSVIGGLMTTAFQDPFYLRYKYKPDCELHKTTMSTQQATQAKVTTTKPHHRTSKTERSKVLREKAVSESKSSSYKKGKSRSSASSLSRSGLLFAFTILATSLQWEMHNR